MTMQIVKTISDSFQEYKNHQSLVLFSRGCNFKCHHCYNQKHMNGKPTGNAKDIILERTTPMHDAVVFLGGEPTIWGDKLIDAAQFAKDKMKLEVKIFTNGFLTDVIQKLIKTGSVDAFSVDLKCVDHCKDLLGIEINDVDYVKAVCNSIEAIASANIPFEIRTTDINCEQTKKVVDFVNKRFPVALHIVQRDFWEQAERATA